MFRRLDDLLRKPVSLDFEGREIAALEGDNVAAALLAAGVTTIRTTPVTGAPRAPYCMMGVCFDCLMEIDDVPDRQACLVPVRDGMTIRRQAALREVGHAL